MRSSRSRPLPFDQAKGKLRMPVNAMTTKQLREHIKRAVADEYYEDAANIKKELEKRSKEQGSKEAPQ